MFKLKKVKKKFVYLTIHSNLFTASLKKKFLSLSLSQLKIDSYNPTHTCWFPFNWIQIFNPSCKQKIWIKKKKSHKHSLKKKNFLTSFTYFIWNQISYSPIWSKKKKLSTTTSFKIFALFVYISRFNFYFFCTKTLISSITFFNSSPSLRWEMYISFDIVLIITFIFFIVFSFSLN